MRCIDGRRTRDISPSHPDSESMFFRCLKHLVGDGEKRVVLQKISGQYDGRIAPFVVGLKPPLQTGWLYKMIDRQHTLDQRLLTALIGFRPGDPIRGSIHGVLSKKQVQLGRMFLHVAHVVQEEL
jgi:hypothetical protein